MSVRGALGRDLRTTVIAVVAATAVAGPSAAAAAYVANADKVDNKHAVGAGASVAKRKGKLVATHPTTGLLPNNIIAKALDSETVDGLDSTAFLRADGTAANADKLDGRDVSELLPIQVSTSVEELDHEALGDAPDDIATISITVPSPGRIQVNGHSVVMVDPSSDHYSFATLSVSDSPDEHSPDPSGHALWDVPAFDADADGVYRTTIPTTGTFVVTQAGTYTYHLVATGSGDQDDGPFHYSSQMTAQFFPAS